MTKRILCPRLLKAAMRATRTTQTALADAAGVSQVSIHYLLQGERDPAVHIAQAIADYMGVDLGALIKEIDGEPGDVPLSAALALSDRAAVDVKTIAYIRGHDE